ncbi:hypothetical protein BTVI_01360 [Pitangus sulphuratus]|nr:hypothetical protein BTVI_156862 [Pitangus sulphuratus]KAJ7428018.1 hypothetical protein BTVI_01403 [Pitangus sulphuratus]KAJ7428045.1 hypothetical protein BTVI_01360 [Pitangus sulphuratus]
MKKTNPEPHLRSSRRAQNCGDHPNPGLACGWVQDGDEAEGEGRSRREARKSEGRGKCEAWEKQRSRKHDVIPRERPHSPSTTPSSSNSSSLTSLPLACKGPSPSGHDVTFPRSSFRENGCARNTPRAYLSDNPTPPDIWKTCKAQALQTGDAEFLKAFPVFYDNPVNTPEWLPISYPILRDIKKAVTDYGISAPFTLGLLDTLFSAHTLIPHDVRVVAKGLLTTIQYSVFETEWKALITKYVNEKMPKRKAPMDHLINVMFGEGPFADKKQQVGIRREYLNISQDLALQAFKKIADAYTTTPSFTLVQQGQDESFIDFIPRLK